MFFGNGVIVKTYSKSQDGNNDNKESKIETVAVIFVEGTKESKLAKDLRVRMERIKHILW